MLTKMKRNGAKSSAGEVAKKGYKGRLELVAERREDGYHITFHDVGNYGKSRSWGDFGALTAEELLAVAAQLQAVASGQVSSTALSAEQLDTLIASVTPAEPVEEQTPATAEAAETIETVNA